MSARPIRKERWYPHSPEKVWVALTDPRALAEWLMPNDFEPRVGHKFRFQVDPMSGCGHLNLCEVLEVDRPRTLVYSWLPAEGAGADRPGARPATVTWVLAPENGGTRLTLVHDGLDADIVKGEVFGLVGGSGSGKSVLLRTMLGLQKPVAGSVRIEGEEVVGRPERELLAVKRRYGVMFQRGALFT